jgi:hypothetical protein
LLPAPMMAPSESGSYIYGCFSSNRSFQDLVSHEDIAYRRATNDVTLDSVFSQTKYVKLLATYLFVDVWMDSCLYGDASFLRSHNVESGETASCSLCVLESLQPIPMRSTPLSSPPRASWYPAAPTRYLILDAVSWRQNVIVWKVGDYERTLRCREAASQLSNL